MTTETPSSETSPELAAAEVQTALGSPTAAVRPRRLILLVGAAAAVLLLVAFAGFAWQMLGATPQSPVSPAEALADFDVSARQLPRPAATPAPPPATFAEAASWTAAEQAYAAQRWVDAVRLYNALLARSEKSAANDRVSDFFRLRVAQCLKRVDRLREAREQFVEAAESGSPIVRAAACRELAILDTAEGQHLMARMRAFQAIAAMGAVEGQAAIQSDCEFLAACAITRKAAALFHTDIAVPRNLVNEIDPFSGMSETTLRRLLDAGANRIASAALGPWVRSAEGDRSGRRWTVVSSGSPLEEILCRLTAEANVDIRWDGVDAAARRRPVVLCLTGAADQRLVEVACGAVGLVARFSGTETTVQDPTAYTSTSAQRDLLVREAISTWRRFLLHATDDARLAYGRFALGNLYEHLGDSGAAVTEYRVLAERAPTDRLAPLARLRIATMRLDMRDCTGARDELLDLLNRYPDCPASDEVYLRLGQATMEAGRLDEAIEVFKKLYFLDLSLSSRIGATFGAAQCYFRKGQFGEAASWCSRRIDLSRTTDDPALSEAYALLAKAEAGRGRYAPAVQAYKKSLAVAQQAREPVEPGRRIETLLELTRILVRQEELVAAMGILEGLSPRDTTPKQAEEILLAKAEILRAMHLPERAIGILRHGMTTASTPQMVGRMTVELARCLVDSGDTESARKVLAEALPKMEPGPLAQGAALDLADACVKTGHAAQAVTVCEELLKSPCTGEVRRRVQDILSAAYARQRDYQRAAMALTGTPPEGPGATKP